MQKLLIADSSEVFSGALTSALKDRFDIRICGDGPSALALLQQTQPDILIINLMLPYKDGLTVLQQSHYLPPIVMAVTMHLSSYVAHSVAALGVDYTMIAPSVDALVLRLTDLIREYTAPQASADLSAKVVYHLHQLNFANHLDGYKRLCVALELFVQNPHQLLTKELYPAVAKYFDNADPRAVEHSIRMAITHAWKRRDNATWRKYFSFNSQGYIPCPSTKEFLCRLAKVLQDDCGLL